VRLRYGEFRLQAPHVEMDTRTQMLRASAAPGELVPLNWRGRRLSGARAEVNLVTQEGVERNASGQVHALLFKGRSLRFFPSRRRYGRTSSAPGRPEVPTGRRRGVLGQAQPSHTCTEERPHYRLKRRICPSFPESESCEKSKGLLRRVLLFRYPFDYVVRETKQRALQTPSFLPSYERDRVVEWVLGLSLAWGSLTSDL
jgi:hypothetical protein